MTVRAGRVTDNVSAGGGSFVNLAELWWSQFEEQQRRSAERRMGPHPRRRRPRSNGHEPELEEPSSMATEGRTDDAPTACQRPYCGGTLVDFGDGPHCLLCGRGPPEGESTGADLRQAALAALMATPPVLGRTFRSRISDETYERKPGGRPRKWLAWAGMD